MKDYQLLEIHDTSPGYTRKKDGKSWKYFDQKEQITDKKIINRIDGLSIIPTWTNVWICRHPRGYLQATGYDQADRKQYLYHDKWHTYRSEKKLEKMIHFKQNLNEIRKTIQQDLEEIKTYTKPSMCALALWMIDKGRLRIGNWHYHETHETTGTITLQKEHVFENYLKFIGKSSKERRIPIDETWNTYLEHCLESPGHTLLTYQQQGSWERLTAADVRDYLQRIIPDATPKDFRTWWAEVEFIYNFYLSKQYTDSPQKTKILQHVAKELGHTPDVCKKFYITPHVYDGIERIQMKTLETLFKRSRRTKYCSRKEQFGQKVLQTTLAQISR